MNVPATVDRHDLIRTRLYYFLFYAGLGFMSPFLNLFYIQLGLTGTQIGWVTSLGALITLIAAPFWANRNARWQHPRDRLQLFLTLTALSYFLLSQQYVFLGIALVSAFRALVSAGVSPLSDSLALSISRAVRAGFGSIRVWGSLGWVVLVPLSGWIVGQTSLNISLVGAAILTASAALILYTIGAEHFSVKKIQAQVLPNFRSVINRLRSNRMMLAVAALIAIIGLGNSGVLQFESVYLRQLGASDGLIGIAGMLSAVMELPCMLWADRLVSRHGSTVMLLVSMLIYTALRATVLIIPSIATIMLMRAGQGIAFSFYTVALARLIGEQSTLHETRTVMALYTITLTNLVSIVGSPLTGAAFDAFGARWLYLIATAGYFLAFVSLRVARQPANAAST
jgi:PPP family 3-phenylpropionic acid transporter